MASIASLFACNASTPGSQPKVDITGPASNAFAGASIPVTVRAVAPGGITGIRVEVRRGEPATVIGQADATPAPAGSNDYAATMILANAGIAEGAAIVVAVAAWNDNGKPTLTSSSPVGISFDFTPPAIGMVSDGATWLGPANPNSSVEAAVADAAAGIRSVSLTIGSNTVDGVATAGGHYTFTVPMAATGVAAGASATVPFSIAAVDATLGAGNARTLTGDPKEVVKVDRTAPDGSITADAAWYAASETVVVNGATSDAQSGLSGGAAAVTLSGGTLSTAQGTLTATSFSVPADLSAQAFGATESPFAFTVTITDNAGNATSPPLRGSIHVDNKPPAISGVAVISAPDDGIKFFRGASSGTLAVVASIKDSGAGVDPAAVKVTCVIPGNPTAGTVTGTREVTDPDGTEHWTFQVPRSAGLNCGAAGNEPCSGAEAVKLTVSADDNVAARLTGPAKAAHQSTSGEVSLFFDSLAPVVTIGSIFPTGGTGGPGVTYPPAKAGTGHDGAHFFLDESIHISGAVTDNGSGVKEQSLSLRIDGTANGTPFSVAPTVAGCDGTLTCAIEADVVLNQAGNGALDALSEDMLVQFSALDEVANAGAASPPAVGVTRYWWSRQLAGIVVSGLAIHPSGDVIVTGTTSNAANAQDTVFALHDGGPFSADGAGCATAGIKWCYGSADSIGSVPAGAAIGEESAEGSKDSRIYVAAGASGKLLALDVNGIRRWIASAGQFSTTPAVGRASIAGSPVELAFVGAHDHSMYSGREDPATPGQPIVRSSPDLLDRFTVSSPAFVGGVVYAATESAATRIPLTATGSFGASAVYAESAARLTGIAHGGGDLLYAASAAAGGTSQPLQQFTATNPPARGWAAPDPVIARGANGDAVVGSGFVYVPTAAPAKTLQEVKVGDTAVRTVQTYGNAANTVLIGSDGRLYLTLTDGNVHAGVDIADGLSQWNVRPGASSAAPPAMDCAGHLFVGIDDTIFAYITDARGLANAAWPKFHRDSRNSGNADLTTLWGARLGDSCTQ